MTHDEAKQVIVQAFAALSDEQRAHINEHARAGSFVSHGADSIRYFTNMDGHPSPAGLACSEPGEVFGAMWREEDTPMEWTAAYARLCRGAGGEDAYCTALEQISPPALFAAMLNA